MNFFRWLFSLTKRTRAARRALEAEAEGIVADIQEARKKQRIAWGLEPAGDVPALPASATEKPVNRVKVGALNGKK